MSKLSSVQITREPSPTSGTTTLSFVDRCVAHAMQFLEEQAFILPRLEQLVQGYAIELDREFDETDTFLSGRVVFSEAAATAGAGVFFSPDFFDEYFEADYFSPIADGGGAGGIPAPAALPRQVYTTYDGLSLFANVDAVPGGAGPDLYATVKDVEFIGPPSPGYMVTGNCPGQVQQPPTLALLGAVTNPLFSFHNWDNESGIMCADSCGAYIKGRFTGTSLTMDASTAVLYAATTAATEYPWVAVSIDGGVYTRQQVPYDSTGVGTKNLSLATGLVDTTHTFEVIYDARSTTLDLWPNNVGGLRVPATPFHVDVSRAVMGPAHQLPRTMMHFGHSSAEGYLAFPVGTTPQQNASTNWSRIVAELFQAESSVIAVAGQGYLNSTWSVPGCSTSFPNHRTGRSRLTSGLFSPAPDIILTTMGKNDLAYTDAAVNAAVLAMMIGLRAAAPGAKIIMSLDEYGSRPAAITAGFAAYQAAYPADTNVFYADPGSEISFCWTVPPAFINQGHPTPAGSAVLAPVMLGGISRALALTSALYQVKAERIGTLLGYFDVGDDGGFVFFHADADPTHWRFTPIRISDSHLFLPSWTEDVDGLFSSASYEIREAIAHVDSGAYPFVDPAPSFSGFTAISCYVDANGTLTGQVDPDPTLTYTSDARAYALFNTGTGLQVGPPTFISVPNRRTIELRSQFADLRIDMVVNTTTLQWHDVFAVDATGRFVIPKAAGARATLTLVDTTTGTRLASAIMGRGLLRTFRFYPTDTFRLDDGSLAYGSDFEAVGFAYDAAISGAMWLSAARDPRTPPDVADQYYRRVRRLAWGLSQTAQGDGGIPFAHSQEFSSTIDGVKYYRTGAEAWAGYFLFLALKFIPSSYWTAPYDTWYTSILAAANGVLGWVYGQQDSSGLVQFGTGRIDPITLIFDPTYQYTNHSTEHQTDAIQLYLLAADVLADATWHTRATAGWTALVTHHWDATNGRFFQGSAADLTPDGAGALDCYSWTGALALIMGDATRAALLYTRMRALYLTTSPDADGVPAQGFDGFAAADGQDGTLPTVWLEGSGGALEFERRMGSPDDEMLKALARLQQPDGSFYNFQKDTVYGIHALRAITGAAWYALAVLPNNGVLWNEV